MDHCFPKSLDKHYNIIIDGFNFQLSQTNTKKILPILVKNLEQEAKDVKHLSECFYHVKSLGAITLKEMVKSIDYEIEQHEKAFVDTQKHD